MKLRRHVLHSFLAGLVLLVLMACSQTPEPLPLKSVLILYGNPTTGAARTFPSAFSTEVSSQAFSPSEASKLYATMLANLLGRYPDMRVEIKPVSSYTDLGENVRVFYIGSIYDEALPEALLNDAASGKPITWIGYNLWKLSKERQTGLGLSYKQIRSASNATDVDNSYNGVRYRNYLFKKLTRNGSSPVPNEIIEVESTANSSAVIEAWAENVKGEKIPYAIRSNRFWYIADLPFTYAHELDRYLVFADLLGPMMDRDEVCPARAVVRLEGINPVTSTANLKSAVDALGNQQVPFGVAVVPMYQDGVNKVTVNWADRPEALEQLRRALQLRGQIVQNGYTHQYGNGVTLADSEFWNLASNQPKMELTEAIQRLEAGKKILSDLGLNPVGWMTPSNAMSPDFYSQVNTSYPRFFERRLYQVGQGDQRIIQGQFFPYPVRDTSGALMIPENASYIGLGRTPSTIVEIAKANQALRCPWMSVSFNPFLFNVPASQGGVTPLEFEKLIADIRNLGYTFVDISGVDVKK